MALPDFDNGPIEQRKKETVFLNNKIIFQQGTHGRLVKKGRRWYHRGEDGIIGEKYFSMYVFVRNTLHKELHFWQDKKDV